jgi:16S rRNA (cytidine1402-2'-O)-methyltransferase
LTGTFYVVATPIGNLKDITLRAKEVLADVDLVVAENKTRTLKLLNSLGIRKPIITINSDSEGRKAKAICGQLLVGKNCALITSAGTPSVSDPGNELVKACYNAGVVVNAVPGPSAAVSAVSVSGMYMDKFLFFGFLPSKRGKKAKVLRELGKLPFSIVLFESPRRLLETLRCIQEELGERFVAVFKEMTKMHEEVFRGEVGTLIPLFESKEVKGEYTVIVEGKGRFTP